MLLEACLTPKRSIAWPAQVSNIGTYAWCDGHAIGTNLRTLVCNTCVTALATTLTYVLLRHGAW